MLILSLVAAILNAHPARLQPSPHQNYQVHQIWIDEHVDELSNSYAAIESSTGGSTTTVSSGGVG